MVGDRPRYELHFHGLVQSAVVDDYNKVTQIFQDSLARPTSLPGHQLPTDIADFTGRQEELDRLTSLLRQATQGGETALAISVVTGTAGVGKSALAIHVAHQLKNDFPDAQLYVNLRGTDSQPLDPLEVLASFVRAWGVDDQSIPEDLTERSDLYRSLLSDKRVLVLLDNARDEAQVRPLLPDSSTCAVLVTTRRHLTDLEGATVLDLPVMTQPEALELLEKLAGVDRTQAELKAAKNIIDLCAGLPLALRITGGTLRSQPQGKLEDYALQLAQERQRMVELRLSDLDVRATLALSYQDLDATAARLFRLLGLLTGSNFAIALPAALLESELATAEESLKCLLNRQLLEPASEGRYRFHDLVRLFARGQLAQEEAAEARQAARLRASRWYLETSEMMDLALNSETRRQLAKVLVKGKDQSLEVIERNLLIKALNWFEIERANLLASVEWASQAQAWEIVVPLARNLVNFFNTYAYWADWERTHLLALEATRKLGDLPEGDRESDDPRLATDSRSLTHNQEAQTLTNLGNVHSLQSNWGKARECYEKALGIFGELGDRPGVAKTLGNLGNVYFRQDYWGKASECYKQSLDTFRELTDSYGEAQTLANMGILYIQQNDQEQAADLWQEALTKLPPDLPKSKRVAQWLQSIKGLTFEVSKSAIAPPPKGQTLILLGGFIVVIAIALFLLLLMR
jgi:tetratricopeptide (TPR) repeat protein